jgi:uncharacterized protein with GYD domain
MGLKKYIILLRRTNLPIDSKKLEIPIEGNVKKELEKIGINVDFNLLVHGDYDLVLCATTPSIKELKLFSNALLKMFGDYIADIKILEVLFPLQKGGIDNPNIEKITEFF